MKTWKHIPGSRYIVRDPNWSLRPNVESAILWYSSSSERIKERTGCRYKRPYSAFLPQRAPLALLWPLRTPTWKTPSSIAGWRAFLLVFNSYLEEEPCFSKLMFFVGLLCNVYDHVVVEHLPQTKHRKAQSALHKAAKQVRAGQSATAQASRQSWWELACRRAFMQPAAFSKRTKKSKSSRQTIQPLTKQLWSSRDTRRALLYFQSQ